MMFRPSSNFEPTFPRKRPFNEPRSGIKAHRLIIRGLDDFVSFGYTISCFISQLI